MPNPAEINVLYNQDFMNDPYSYFQAGLEHAPITRNEETLAKPYFVFRYEDVRRVLQEPDHQDRVHDGLRKRSIQKLCWTK